MKKKSLLKPYIPKYERATLKLIRSQAPELALYDDNVICEAYHRWSESTYYAGWMSPSVEGINKFIEWSTKLPIERIKVELSEQ